MATRDLIFAQVRGDPSSLRSVGMTKNELSRTAHFEEFLLAAAHDFGTVPWRQFAQ